MTSRLNLLRFQAPPGQGPVAGTDCLPDPENTTPPEAQPESPVSQHRNRLPIFFQKQARKHAPGGENQPHEKPTPVRLVSLDAFRGLTILGMLLVNNIALGDRTPAQLLHAEWSGDVHMADFVFPWFLFIVGVALPYSVASARRRHLDLWQFDLKALSRAVLLVYFGCVINSFEKHRIVFDLDVLQLIGLAFLCTVVLGGLVRLPGRLILAAGLLIANWAILKKVPIPGHGAGHFTEQLNVIDYLNGKYLAPYNLQGLLSVIPTTALVLIGTAAGDLLRRKKVSAVAKVVVLAVCGAGMVAVGLVWSHPGMGVYALPMNKPCWSASYILYCAGWGAIVLAGLYAVIDATRGKWGAILAFPLIVFGMNAIVAYVTPVLTKVAILRNIQTTWPLHHAPMNMEDALHEWFYLHFGRFDGGLAYTCTYIALWWCVLLVLWRKRWFLRV